MASALFQWRMRLQEMRVKQKMEKISECVENKNLLRTVFNEWRNLMKNKWKIKVEKGKFTIVNTFVRINNELI